MKGVNIWMSFDLGVKGDYQGLYAFLDAHKAVECGQSVALFKFEYEEDMLEELKQRITDVMTVDRRTRIYIIRSRLKDGKTVTSGRFLIGSRRAAPWQGYGGDVEPADEETDEPSR